MDSANGFLVQCAHGLQHNAAWPAPWFVFVFDDGDVIGDQCGCMLIHAESEEHALAVARRGGSVLGPHFEIAGWGCMTDPHRARVAAEHGRR